MIFVLESEKGITKPLRIKTNLLHKPPNQIAETGSTIPHKSVLHVIQEIVVVHESDEQQSPFYTKKYLNNEKVQQIMLQDLVKYLQIRS